MKVFRFMSQEEFDKYLAGENLVNKTDHKKRFSGSEGFCFFEYMDWDDDGVDGISPEYAYKFMQGVATMDVVAVFETDKELTKSYGRYADPYGGFFDTIWMDEYCTEEYSRDTFRLIKYGHIEYDDDFESKAVWNTESNMCLNTMNVAGYSNTDNPIHFERLCPNAFVGPDEPDKRMK